MAKKQQRAVPKTKKKTATRKAAGGAKSKKAKGKTKKPAARPAAGKPVKTTKKKKKKKKKTATTARKPAARKSAKRTTKPKTSLRGSRSLGRPRVPGSTKLDLFLRHDYEAQEVFNFLNVTTVKELEAHTPQEIIERLTAPVARTIDKIRKALAINNRCLAGDQRFAREFQQAFQKR